MTLEIQINLLEDNNGVPGNAIANDQINLNDTFFVEIFAGDIRNNAAGIVGLELDIQWDPAILEAIDFNASDVITNNLPFEVDGTLDNTSGSINDLGGGALPNANLGTAIGVNSLERFALLRFRADSATNNAIPLTVSVSNGQVAFADAEPFVPGSEQIEEQTLEVVTDNTPPTITSNATFQVAENTTTVGTITATDADGDNLTFNLAGGADQALLTINDNSGELSFNTAPDFETPADANSDNNFQVSVGVSDATETVTQDLTITVTDVNDKPTITSNATFQVAESTTTVGTITATDADGDNLTFTINGGADQGLFTINNSGELSFNNAPDFETAADANGDNNYQVSVEVSDGTLTETQDLTISVTNVNETPTITSNATFQVAENTTTVGTITATDIDGDNLTFTINGGADQGLFTINNSGELSFNNAPDFETAADADSDNNYQVSVGVSDGTETVTQDLTITVTDVNDKPSITSNDTFEVAENTTTVGTITATDADGDNLTFNLVDGADQGLFTINDSGELSFNNAPDFETAADANGDNNYQVSVGVSDGTLTETQDLTITVTDVYEPEAPIAEDATFTIDENSEEETEVGIVTATDGNNEALNFAITSGNLDPDNDGNLAFAINPSTGTITVNDSEDLDFETTPSFNLEVTVTDPVDLSDTANITVNVEDIPVAQFETPSNNGIFSLNAEGSTNLKFTLANTETENVNEVGVFLVDDESGSVDGNAPGSDGYLQAALETAQIIFSAISDRPNGFDIEDIERVLEVDDNARLGFYLVSNGTTDTALAELESTGATSLPVFFSDSSNLQVSDFSGDGFNLNWSDQAGGSDFTDLDLRVELTQDAPAPFTKLQREEQKELLDLRDETGSVSISVEVQREAAFDNLIGFYQVVDTNGGIDTDGDGIADINPGDTGYKEAALTNRVTGLDLLATDNQQSTTIDGTLEGGNIFASFIVVDGSVDEALQENTEVEVYFSFLGANSDGVDHIRLLGDNTFGFEDLPNGGDLDYNDMIITVEKM